MPDNPYCLWFFPDYDELVAEELSNEDEDE